MSAHIRHLDLCVDYFVLADPQPDGPVVGIYDGHPIAAEIVDASGTRYEYAGVATFRADGAYDVEALRLGEWIVPPGLVYRCLARLKAAG